MQGKAIIQLRCKGCQKDFKAYKPESPGTYPVICPHCQHKNYIKIEKPINQGPPVKKVPVTIKAGSVGIPTMGKLVWHKYLIPHKYVLHDGANTIGRVDEEEPSDLSVKDRFISRKSAIVEVINTVEMGTIYRFLLKKTKNPVFVNKRQMKIGESIYLKFGDVIKMGNTVFKFKEVKK